MNLKDLKEEKIGDLIKTAEDLGVEGAAGKRKQELIFSILQAQTEKKGMIFSGTYPKGNLAEIVEIRDHPYFIAVQYHPEFKSKPLSPHPLFLSFIKSAI